jgi:hypothetical protein
MQKRDIIYVLKTLGLFLIISFGADKLIYLTLNRISDKVYSGQGIGKVNHFLKIKNSRELIIFGSSRANHNVNPTVLNNSGFNMGVDGRKIAYASTLIKLLPKDKKQTVLLHIDPDNFFDEGYSGIDVNALLSKYNRIDQVKNEINALGLQNVFQQFYWSLSYNGKVFSILKNVLKPKYDYKKYNGFDPIKVSSDQKKMFENILAQNKKTICQDSLVINPIYDKLLNEIKLFCDNNSKRLVLFTSPMYKDLCKEDNRKMNRILLRKEFEYYDFTNYFENKSSLNNWKDKTHLSNLGAEEFTQVIKNSVQIK